MNFFFIRFKWKSKHSSILFLNTFKYRDSNNGFRMKPFTLYISPSRMALLSLSFLLYSISIKFPPKKNTKSKQSNQKIENTTFVAGKSCYTFHFSIILCLFVTDMIVRFIGAFNLDQKRDSRTIVTNSIIIMIFFLALL